MLKHVKNNDNKINLFAKLSNCSITQINPLTNWNKTSGSKYMRRTIKKREKMKVSKVFSYCTVGKMENSTLNSRKVFSFSVLNPSFGYTGVPVHVQYVLYFFSPYKEIMPYLRLLLR